VTFLLNALQLLNCRLTSYILRVLAQGLMFNGGYTSLLPIPEYGLAKLQQKDELVNLTITLKSKIVSTNVVEAFFMPSIITENLFFSSINILERITSLLHTVEGLLERTVFDVYELSDKEIPEITASLSQPSGWYPLIAGYEVLPELPEELELPTLPPEVVDYLAQHQRIQLEARELARIKSNLRALYEAGPGAKEVEQEEAAEVEGEEEEGVSGAHIPIPTETFLEELSVKLQIHPISVYWLLQELRAEGARCKPEELRLLEDRLSVLVLRLLGHRWPRQIEAGEAVPEWADQDGIIPLIAGAGEATLAERLRLRLRAEEGELGAQKSEALLQELTNQSLEEWLRGKFFTRHVRQFKYRPIAWHLASAPLGGKKGSRRAPAFECLLYYHACGVDALARLRTQYLEPLIRAERQKEQEERRANNDSAAALAADRQRELEAFAEKLQAVEEEGFASPDLDKLQTGEPLDRWGGDGYLPPRNPTEFWHNERAWKVDINDGVRANIAPLQLAGLLVSDVLKTVDAKKAIADRARWRADERRWVREGKLPRCGWLPEEVLESPSWTMLAPQRAAEQLKLEQKKKALEKK